jgi:hypothetical protein
MKSASISNDANLGQIAFEAHCANGGGQHVYGRLITDWNALSPMAQEAWYQASLAVVEVFWKEKQGIKSIGVSGNGFAQEIRASFDFATNEFKVGK